MTQQLNAGSEAQFERYAVYWTPEPGSPLAEFGRSWLGYDADTGNPVTQRDDRGLGLDLLDRITRTPRHYGFHGTLLAPYRLREGKSASELLDRMQRFAARRRPVAIGPLRLERLFDFLALVPQKDAPALGALHAECAFAFDPFWAPLTDDEHARHRATGLSHTQRLMLAQWGYPRMLGDFPFHLTAHQFTRWGPGGSDHGKTDCESRRHLPAAADARIDLALRGSWVRRPIPGSRPLPLQGLTLAEIRAKLDLAPLFPPQSQSFDTSRQV